MAEFGKDLGVVHEAVVAGRNTEGCAIGKRFWAALAHTPDIFNVVGPLVDHLQIIEEFSIDVTKPVDDRTDEWQEWFLSLNIGSGCITCLRQEMNIQLLGISQPQKSEVDDAGHWTSAFWDKVRTVFHAALCQKIEAMGLSVVELCATTSHWKVSKQGEDHSCRSSDTRINGSAVVVTCCSFQEMVAGMKLAITQRHFLQRLRGDQE